MADAPALFDRHAARMRAAEVRAAGWSYTRITREVGIPAPTLNVESTLSSMPRVVRAWLGSARRCGG
jgi:hypothetical protein